MSVKILEVKKESFPAARFIGKKYTQGPNWGEWWQNDWFSVLEKKERLLNNGDAYFGAVHIVDEMPEYWIGMFFPINTEVPEGFDFVDIASLDYAVCYLQDKEGSGDFYTMESGDFMIIYPDEIHKPGIKVNENKYVKKAILKVAVGY